ncbi:MAG: tyrosine-type recombinase/integrase [Candidatus Thermoplasmatota archaeon]|nr:tyrosine-type recombinase/integrase [Candidatus Thermoplasmatota archaeon]
MNEAQEEFKGKADVERYLAKLRADRLDIKTQKKHGYHLRAVLKFLNKYPKEITLEDIEKWQYESVVNRKYDIETVHHNFLILRRFLRFLGRHEIAEKMTIPKCSKRIPPEKEIWLLPPEQEAFIKKSRELGIRTEAIVRLFLSTGIRIGELQSLRISDINFEEQTIQIRHGKGDKTRVVFFDSETKRALREYLAVRKDTTDGGDILFTSSYGTKLSQTVVCNKIKECAILAGIKKKITPHKLRHTFITTVIEKTKDIPLAQKLAGHTEISTTMRYHHNTFEEIKSKYMEYFDSRRVKDPMAQKMSAEEIIRTLDSKYLKNEIPLEIYTKLREEYARAISKAQKDWRREDPAYL